jgi:hypothetical protein
MSHWGQYDTFAEWTAAGKPAPSGNAMAMSRADAEAHIARNPLAVQAVRRGAEKLGSTQPAPRAATRKRYAEMTAAEKHALWIDDPETYAELRDEPEPEPAPSYAGKCWAEMTPSERVQLTRDDPRHTRELRREREDHLDYLRDRLAAATTIEARREILALIERA